MSIFKSLSFSKEKQVRNKHIQSNQRKTFGYLKYKQPRYKNLNSILTIQVIQFCYGLN